MAKAMPLEEGVSDQNRNSSAVVAEAGRPHSGVLAGPPMGIGAHPDFRTMGFRQNGHIPGTECIVHGDTLVKFVFWIGLDQTTCIPSEAAKLAATEQQRQTLRSPSKHAVVAAPTENCIWLQSAQWCK